MEILQCDAFKGSFIKAQDLGGRPLQVTIESVSTEKVGDDTKPVVRMRGLEQGWVLNLTNAQMLAEILGTTETSEWVGRKVELYPTTTQFGSKTVPAIRVREAVDMQKDLPFDNGLPADL